MTAKFVRKDSFTVLGVLGRGPADSGPAWVPEVWRQADAGFSQIAGLVKYNADGSLYGLWGAMSDVGGHFERWGERGLYLAGCEADADVAVPEGFTKWTLPARTYLVFETTAAGCGETLHKALTEYLPQNGYTAAGAIQEHYPAPGTDRLELYVPVEAAR